MTDPRTLADADELLSDIFTEEETVTAPERDRSRSPFEQGVKDDATLEPPSPAVVRSAARKMRQPALARVTGERDETKFAKAIGGAARVLAAAEPAAAVSTGTS